MNAVALLPQFGLCSAPELIVGGGSYALQLARTFAKEVEGCFEDEVLGNITWRRASDTSIEH